MIELINDLKTLAIANPEDSKSIGQYSNKNYFRMLGIWTHFRDEPCTDEELPLNTKEDVEDFLLLIKLLIKPVDYTYTFENYKFLHKKSLINEFDILVQPLQKKAKEQCLQNIKANSFESAKSTLGFNGMKLSDATAKLLKENGAAITIINVFCLNNISINKDMIVPIIQESAKAAEFAKFLNKLEEKKWLTDETQQILWTLYNKQLSSTTTENSWDNVFEQKFKAACLETKIPSLVALAQNQVNDSNVCNASDNRYKDAIKALKNESHDDHQSNLMANSVLGNELKMRTERLLLRLNRSCGALGNAIGNDVICLFNQCGQQGDLATTRDESEPKLTAILAALTSLPEDMNEETVRTALKYKNSSLSKALSMSAKDSIPRGVIEDLLTQDVHSEKRNTM